MFLKLILKIFCYICIFLSYKYGRLLYILVILSYNKFINYYPANWIILLHSPLGIILNPSLHVKFPTPEANPAFTETTVKHKNINNSLMNFIFYIIDLFSFKKLNLCNISLILLRYR